MSGDEQIGSTRVLSWLVAFVIGALIATGLLMSDLADLRDQREDRDLFLRATSDGWLEASNEFFRSPAAAAHLVGASRDTQVTVNELLAAVQLDNDIDAAFVGHLDGSFTFAARDEDRGFRSRTITIDGADRTTELAWYEPDLALRERTLDPTDDYDPRLRPWFAPIADGEPSAWSAPYTFASSGQPGITYSAAVVDEAGQLAAVVGIDVRLTALNEFLDKLRPGPSGIAALLARDGNVIAIAGGSSEERDTRTTNAAALDAEPGLLAAIDQVGAIAAATPTHDDVAIVSLPDDQTAAARTFGLDGQWTLVAIAHDDDFVSAEERPGMLALKWAAMALPAAVLTLAVLRPALKWLRSLHRTATLDELTGLANRPAITERLRRALGRSDRSIAVAILDLDSFKPINDTWGHECGDDALQEVGLRLRAFAELHGMYAGRLGGDEFLLVAIAPDIEALPEAWDRLVADIGAPFKVGELDVPIGASVGVALVHGGDDRTSESALRRADRALYRVKAEGGNGWLAHSRHAASTTADIPQLDLRERDPAGP